ncbi:MAG: HEAT repeat domain-containing protein [Planctomycetota bacterium]
MRESFRVVIGALFLGVSGLAFFAWPPPQGTAPANAPLSSSVATRPGTRRAQHSTARQADSGRLQHEERRESARRAAQAEQAAALEAFLDEVDLCVDLATDLVEAKRGRDPESPETIAEFERIRTRYRAVRSRLIRRVDRDRASADLFYEEIRELEDGDVQRELAQVLPFVASEAFGRQLAAVARSDSDPTSREVALIGLRGRGATGADAVIEVAETAVDPSVRSAALRELRGHLGDPRAIRSMRRGISVTERHLFDEDASVRRAALITLGTMRGQPSASMRERVQQIAESDPDGDIRVTARSLLSRWS